MKLSPLKRPFKRNTYFTRIFLIIITVSMLYPVLWIILSSFKNSSEFLGEPLALPSKLEWDNYVRAFVKSNIGSNLKNSLYVVVLSLFFLAVLVIPTSYCLSRHHFWGRKFMKTMYMSLIFIQISCIMVPLFLQMNSLGWLNKLTPLALLYAVLQVPFSIFLLSGYMENIPREFEEAAMLDGCSYWRVLINIVIPMAKPGIITVLMLAGMNSWNEYVVAQVMLTDPAKQTVPVGVVTLFEVQRYATDWGALFAGIVIILIPTAIAYAFGQKYLVEGVSAGGLKG